MQVTAKIEHASFVAQARNMHAPTCHLQKNKPHSTCGITWHASSNIHNAAQDMHKAVVQPRRRAPATDALQAGPGDLVPGAAVAGALEKARDDVPGLLGVVGAAPSSNRFN